MSLYFIAFIRAIIALVLEAVMQCARRETGLDRGFASFRKVGVVSPCLVLRQAARIRDEISAGHERWELACHCEGFVDRFSGELDMELTPA